MKCIHICYLFFFIFLFSNLQADNCCPKEKSAHLKLPSGYNAPYAYDTWKISLTGSLLCLQALEKGLPIGSYAYDDTSVEGKVVNMQFLYHSGFKLGLGIQTPYDNWHLFFDYRHFHPTNKTEKLATLEDDGFLIPLWLIDTETRPLKTVAKCNLNLNLIEGACGRKYYVGKKLIFNPFWGLIGGWIDQKFVVDYFTDRCCREGEISFNQSESHLIGPKVGILSKWLLAHGLYFNGNFTAALCYQHFKVQTKEISDSLFMPFFKNQALKNSPDTIFPILEIGVGVGWGTNREKRKRYIDLNIEYDFSVFWNQNRMRQLYEIANFFVDGAAGNLYLQGFKITAEIGL